MKKCGIAVIVIAAVCAVWFCYSWLPQPRIYWGYDGKILTVIEELDTTDRITVGNGKIIDPRKITYHVFIATKIGGSAYLEYLDRKEEWQRYDE